LKLPIFCPNIFWFTSRKWENPHSVGPSRNVSGNGHQYPESHAEWRLGFRRWIIADWFDPNFIHEYHLEYHWSGVKLFVSTVVWLVHWFLCDVYECDA
jgi:hypothetical protein